MSTTTPFVRLAPEDVFPDFDPKDPPDPAGYWDEEALAPSDEWNKLRMRWVKTKAYQTLHSPKYIPIPGAYEIPKPAMHWADEVMDGKQTGPLLLFGTVGVGKTHGACALACFLAAFWDRQLYTGAPSVLFQAASSMVEGLKNFGSRAERDKLYFDCVKAKVLVIDDLTRFKTSDYDMESIGRVLDERQGAGLPTIVTLNDVTNGDEVGERVPPFLASRLMAGIQLTIVGKDRRA